MGALTVRSQTQTMKRKPIPNILTPSETSQKHALGVQNLEKRKWILLLQDGLPNHARLMRHTHPFEDNG
jgi:hypothetical protein